MRQPLQQEKIQEQADYKVIDSVHFNFEGYLALYRSSGIIPLARASGLLQYCSYLFLIIVSKKDCIQFEVARTDYTSEDSFRH
jgi:hypothetical protein